MKNIKKRLKHIPFIGAILQDTYRFFKRLRVALIYLLPPNRQMLRWLFQSNEVNNFSYDLAPTNKHYLAALLADITDKNYEEVVQYFDELEHDEQLREHVNRYSDQLAHDISKKVNFFGRRIGWYAFVRATKPSVVVETGVDRGLGSCVLAAALLRNREEGFLGTYYGIDINPEAGYIFREKYAEVGKIIFGDSIESLRNLNQPIDLFISDSDHSETYEAQEYLTISDKLGNNAIILADNAHETLALLNYSLITNRSFLFFKEQPINHWYPGAGIGISFKRSN